MTELPFTADHLLDAATLTAAGLHSHDLERLVRSGRLHPLVGGWYATRPPDGPGDRHGLTARALARHFAGRAGVSHHSRLVVAGLPTWRADLSIVALTRRDDRGSRSRRGYRVFPSVPGLVMADTAAGPAVPLGAAIVQTGLLNGRMDALVAADAALFRSLVTPDELVPAVGLFCGARGIGPGRALLRHADGRHESPGETRTSHALRSLGLAHTPQVLVTTAQGTKRVDALLDDAPAVVEFDGRVKYDGPAPERVRTDPLFAEKRREDAIRDELYEVVWVVWAELDDLTALGRRIRAARDRAVARVA
ncbi:hypothetical protein [Terracoccus luteus]|uniref:Uncharacterized protein n=1 Tax=Terracoccus luteus TaxID=53356 RepID=A0A839PRU2_9MICO|nr:hypothetical protein [Terracoccus luteus]MBB2985789.1 hypothetical protein [Terracoccus luteus]MCP2171441.1 hypothetical protein [Terracoccus luteus]